MFCTSVVKQRVVTKFLTVKASSPIEIHRCQKIGYNEDAIDVSSGRHWVCCFNRVKKDIGDMVCSSWLSMAATTETKEKIDVLMWDDYHFTTSKLCATTGSGKPAVMSTIREFGYTKAGARWVRKMLTIQYKTVPKHICAELLQFSEKDGDAFLSNIMTGDETWLHHYDP